MNRFCQNCNQLNPSEAAFCLNCASPLSPAQFGGGQPGKPSFTKPFGSTNGAGQRAKTAFGLGFAGLFCCGPIASVPAIIVGWLEINSINQGQSSPDGKNLATAGIVIGILSLLLQGGGFILWVLLAAAEL